MRCILWRFGFLGLLLLSLAGAFAQQFATGVVFHDRNRNGIRDAGEPGVPNVLVSNQREVVKTDAQGRYRLPVGDDTIIFVVKPRGWMTPVSENNVPRFYYVHKPNGSIRVQYGGAPPTGALPASVDFPLYPQRESDRYSALMFGDTQPRDMTEVFYIGRDVVRELIGTKEAAFGVVLGDVLFDDLNLFPALTAMMGQIGAPIYYVLGNHDINFDSPDDQNSDETWHRYFGPNYYAFQWGRAHYIVLDDVVWFGAQGEQRGRYVAGLGERQIEFLRNYLRYVNRNDMVVLLMHIPMWEWPDEERRQVFDALAPFPNTVSYSAHTHVQMHRFFGADAGWKGRTPHHHINAVTVCGSWWRGAPDPIGIPHTTMRDGTPNGYLWMDVNRNRYRVRYKAARRPADYQMHIYAPDEVERAKLSETPVLVNYFFGSEFCTVEMRTGNGDWIRMQQVPDQPDPAYAELKRQEEEFKLPGRPLPGIQPAVHLWRANLPADLPRGMHQIEVRVRNLFGDEFRDKRVIRVR
ncbi:MAG: calcineurin-like phosphoesterase family protein [Fimbriimonadales bacterium]|nr:calcineurin-like phosphoesterase family protein [Fimbriimonadales bacterium]